MTTSLVELTGSSRDPVIRPAGMRIIHGVDG